MAAPILLVVPGTLRYRSIAVRAVAEAARMVSGSRPHDPDDLTGYDVRHPFDTAVVSAFMEIFNNIAIHAYQGAPPPTATIAITLAPADRELTIEIRDHGEPFDLAAVAPIAELDEANLPEGGMGIHIAKQMLDDMTYEPGPPNRWCLRKRLTDGLVGRS